MTLTGEAVELVKNSLIFPDPEDAVCTIPGTDDLLQVIVAPAKELVGV